ncbi:hypothetical protein ABPG73_021121 [Tetrahymena malaccensis]
MINQQGILCNFILLLIDNSKGMEYIYHLKQNKNYYGNLYNHHQKKMINFVSNESMRIIISFMLTCQMCFVGTYNKEEQNQLITHIIHQGNTNFLHQLLNNPNPKEIKT